MNCVSARKTLFVPDSSELLIDPISAVDRACEVSFIVTIPMALTTEALVALSIITAKRSVPSKSSSVINAT